MDAHIEEMGCFTMEGIRYQSEREREGQKLRIKVLDN